MHRIAQALDSGTHVHRYLRILLRERLEGRLHSMQELTHDTVREARESGPGVLRRLEMQWCAHAARSRSGRAGFKATGSSGGALHDARKQQSKPAWYVGAHFLEEALSVDEAALELDVHPRRNMPKVLLEQRAQ